MNLWAQLAERYGLKVSVCHRLIHLHTWFSCPAVLEGFGTCRSWILSIGSDVQCWTLSFIAWNCFFSLSASCFLSLVDKSQQLPQLSLLSATMLSSHVQDTFQLRAQLNLSICRWLLVRCLSSVRRKAANIRLNLQVIEKSTHKTITIKLHCRSKKDIYRVVHGTAIGYTFFLVAHGTFSKIDPTLGHRILNKVEQASLEVPRYLTSNHSVEQS